MARSKREKMIVYHGTWSSAPPHEKIMPKSVFHAGTLNSAYTRIGDTMPRYRNNPTGETIHAYEIQPHAPMGMMTYTDPDRNKVSAKYFDDSVSKTADNYASDQLDVSKGDNTKRIRKYVNLIEDPGDMSYLIPKDFVESGYVRYLGPQFVNWQQVTHSAVKDA